jgi:hypothetical protein
VSLVGTFARIGALALALGLATVAAGSGDAQAGATTTATASAPQAKPGRASKRPAKPRPAPLEGETFDFVDDGAGLGGKPRTYAGRVFVPSATARAAGPRPLVVFFHGLNRERIAHRWMGGGDEGDVRRMVGALVASGAIEPAVLAGPGSVEPAAVSGGSSFPAFDLPRFLDRVEARLAESGSARVDRSRVVVVGHSGAGCSERGGIVTALGLSPAPRAIVSIDTCMGLGLARSLARAAPTTGVVVTWQTATWSRGFDAFRVAFEKESREHPAAPGAARALEALPALPRAHDATVAQTLDAWLPRLLPPQVGPR